VVEDFRAESIASLVMAACPPGTYPEQWNVADLKENVAAILNLDPPIDAWMKEEALEQEVIIERLQAEADERMAAKRALADPAGWVGFEKNMLIQTLDHFWKEHLHTLDALRQVIHLRSYAQKKPIDEYKQEAFMLFERLLIAIREDVTRMLMFTEIAPQQPAFDSPALPDFITHHIDPLSGDDDSGDIDRGVGFDAMPPRSTISRTMPDGSPVPVPESRNALCPCGSGRKYKHCHGQVG
jgi:preprotein translocase subunit SecA